MEELRVGVIGTGAIGREHMARIHDRIPAARVTAVTSRTRESMARAAETWGARPVEDYHTLISDAEVDAVIVSSVDPLHAPAVLACIEAEKPVFCEKPLATAAADCEAIMKAEVAFGRPLVQVGFQRRYDRGYLQLKEMLQSRNFGQPLMVHCAHRNHTAPDDFNTEFAVYRTAVHEIDATHWLLDDEYVSGQVFFPRQTPYADEGFLRDPQFMVLRTQKGILIDIEVFLRTHVAYDIQCEICCTDGILRLPEPSFPLVRQNEMRCTRLENDWMLRFMDAYDAELEDWVHASLRGEVRGPSAFDGYVAAATCDALAKSQKTGREEPIKTGPRPDFYRRSGG